MLLKKIFLLSYSAAISFALFAQHTNAEISKKKEVYSLFSDKGFTIEKNNAATAVKNQANTGTCWSFSTTALLESQLMKNNNGNFDLSEMFTVRNMYLEKAKNYILRQGHTQFSEGGLGHDVIRSVARYGAMPESVYAGLLPGQVSFNHAQLISNAKLYLDSILTAGLSGNGNIAQSGDWMKGYVKILDRNLGIPPAEFVFNNKKYTPSSFANELMNFKADDYVNITSFTHQPFYQPFVLEVPDNFSGGSYYNIPLNEMIEMVKNGLQNGFTFMWDADVSNDGFMQRIGIAVLAESSLMDGEAINPDIKEMKWDANIRQQLFENLTTQDDHLMQITGLGKSTAGKHFFIVKNSWGKVGPFDGYINISETYFAINTISLVVPKAAIDKKLLEKLKLNSTNF